MGCIDALFFGILGALMAVMLGLLGYMAYDGIVADKFSLRKDSWECTREHTEMGQMLVGKVMVPTFNTVCDQWTAK